MVFLVDLGYDPALRVLDVLFSFGIVLLTIDLDLDRFVFGAVRLELDAVLTGDDLDFLQVIAALLRLTGHDHEFGFRRTAILGQDDPAVGERGAKFRTIEGLDLRATLQTGLAGDGAFGLVVVLVHFVGVAADLINERLLLVQGHKGLRKRHVLDHDVLLGGLNRDIQTLSGLSIQNHFGADFALGVLNIDLINIGLPVIVVFQSAIQLVGDVLEFLWHILIIDIQSIFQHVSDLFHEVLLRQRRAPALVVLALLFRVVLLVLAHIAFQIHLLTTAFGLSAHLDVVAIAARLTPAQLSLTQDLLVANLIDRLRIFRIHHLGVQAGLPLVGLLTVYFHVDFAVTLLSVVDVGQFHQDLAVRSGLELQIDLGLVAALDLVIAIFLEGIAGLLRALLLLLLSWVALLVLLSASVRFAMFGRCGVAVFGAECWFGAGLGASVFVVLGLLLVEEVERWLVHILTIDLLHFAVDADLDVLTGLAGLAGDNDLVLAGQRREWCSLRA